MGFFNILDPVLDFILRPLLNLGHLWFLFIISFIISIGLIIVTKYLTDQKLMKELKDSIKKYQDEAKLNKSNPKKMMEIQRKTMELNLQYMKHSFKPTLYSFIPIIILFGWMSANIAYLPIKEGSNFNVSIIFEKNFNGDVTIDVPENIELLAKKTQKTVNGKISWELSSRKEGDYELNFDINDEILTKKVLITKYLKYAPIDKREKNFIDYIYGSKEGYLDRRSKAIQVILSNKSVKPLGDISIFGWKPGWLGIYIIFSLIFTMILRKMLKVY